MYKPNLPKKQLENVAKVYGVKVVSKNKQKKTFAN